METLKWLFRVIKDLIIQSKDFKLSKEVFDNKETTDTKKVISFNIERDKASKNDWPIRREQIVSFIREESPDIICMQEVMPHQHRYLRNNTLGDYSMFFTDTITKNSVGLIISEGLLIAFKDKYAVKECDYINLSNCFGFKTKHWRICQILKLRNKKEIVYVFNTHLDHIDREARNEGFRKILDRINHIKNSDDFDASNTKFFICGDFNTEITWDEVANSFAKQFNCMYFSDGTVVDKTICIDYIFTNIEGNYNCIREEMSDHYPVIFTV